MIKIQHPRLTDICNSYTDYIVCRNKKLKNNIYIEYVFTPERLRHIVACPADRLHDIIIDFNSYFSVINTNSTEWNEFCKYMINLYKSVRNEYLPQILHELNLSVCPYCNRQYIFTVNNGRRVSAQFDHFYSKTKYPYLALSFYNLIPCCPVCNKAKGERIIDINPYLEGFENECTIQIDSPLNCIFQNGDWGICIKGEKKHKKNIETFVLDKLYEKHKDYAMEIVFKEIAHEKGYLDTIKKEFMNIGVSDDLINRILFNYDTNTDNPKRPLSKMTNDIIKQIKDYLLKYGFQVPPTKNPSNF